MKKFIISIIFLIITSTSIYSQGDVSTPYSTSGWDSPIEYTTHYHLPVYQLLSNPGGWINITQKRVDSLLNALVVYTKAPQLAIVNDTLVFSDSLSGINSFSGTAVVDTISIPGLKVTDVVVVSVRDAIPTSNDNLGVFVEANQALIKRNAGGTSGLKYNWIWIKK